CAAACLLVKVLLGFDQRCHSAAGYRHTHTRNCQPSQQPASDATGGEIMQAVPQRKKTPVTLLAVSIGFALQAQALVAVAQDAEQAARAPAAAPAGDAQTLDTMVVTGYRASLEKALDIKRGEAGVVDAIVAEDIADFPDLNLAESLQRIPGVS